MSISESVLGSGPPHRRTGRATHTVARLASAWATALGEVGFLPLSPHEREHLLTGLATRLVDVLTAEPFSSYPARAVGAAMVEAHIVGADALERTIAVLGEHLTPDPTDPVGADPVGTDREPTLSRRLASVQAAVAAGYVQASQARTLAHQESIRAADLNARRQIEESLRASEARFRAVFTEAAIGIGVSTMDGTIIEVNKAFARMLGYTVEEFLRLRVDDLFLPEDGPVMWETYQRLLRGETSFVQTEKMYRRKDGSQIWTNLVSSLIRDGDGAPRYTVAMVEDISERRELRERLRHEATHDPLTGLPNRALFLERLTAAFGDPNARVGVCYLDLDGFKRVNDTVGHGAGDALLDVVARRLDRCVSRLGHMVARMGGDEFVVLVERSTGQRYLTRLAAELIAATEEPVEVAGQRLQVSASVGVVEHLAASSTPIEIMKAADSCLYWAKADGRGRYAVFDPHRIAREASRSALCEAIPGAIGRGEFRVEYQPLVRLADRRMCGVEALVRWAHPEQGMIPPTTFIGLAEESGAIVPLGQWVLEQSCRQARRWQEEFAEAAPYVSVNLSVWQLRDPSVVGQVAEVLRRTGLAPDRLQLELTESAVLGSAGQPLSALRELAAMGVRLAIDDFGTGYSNLAYLRPLPVHTLKLAGQFIADMGGPGRRSTTGPDDRGRPDPDPCPVPDDPVVTGVVGMAHGLGLTVVAEGVETAEQACWLRTLGCDIAQGWHFARAEPADRITARLVDVTASNRPPDPSTPGPSGAGAA